MATGVNPADAAVVLKVLQDTWDLAAERMLDTVAKRLARGITDPGWAEQKAREVLALRSELAAIVQRANTSTPKDAAEALEEAYRIGAGAAGVVGQPSIRSRPEAVQTLATRLTTNLQGTVLPVIRAHEDLFRRAVGESELLMTTGTITRRDAVAQTVDRLLVDGVDRFRDASGRRWHLDAYARMAGRTAAGQSMVQGQLDDMVSRGRDLVVISDSPRECAHCRPWEGRLLSISGASVGQEVDGRRVTGTVSEARGAGLWHPNCTHRADPYTPGLTRIKEPQENPEGYADQQKLRGYERTARDLKRRLDVAERLGSTDEARKLRAKIRANSARIKAHTEATGQLRRRDRERPVGGGSESIAAEMQPKPRPPSSKPSTTRRAPEPAPATEPRPKSAALLDRERAAVHADRALAKAPKKHREQLHELVTNMFTGVPESKAASLQKVTVVPADRLASEDANAQYSSAGRVISTKPSYLARQGQLRRDGGDFEGWFADVGDMDTVQATFHHEFGHHLDALLTAEQRQQLLDELAAVDPDASDSYGTRWTDRHLVYIGDNIGIYACSNTKELLAELWAQYRGNGRKDPWSLIVGRWFEADNQLRGRPSGEARATEERPNRPALARILARLRQQPVSPARDRVITKVERQLRALSE